MTRLHQQTANCADFDVLLGHGERPSFRVLLPEWIRGEGLKHTGLFHVIPGTWNEQKHGVSGHFTAADQLDIEVRVETGETAIHVMLRLKNVDELEISDVWANVCASVNHLPGEPGWSNECFIPGVPLDRTAQGRYWFEILTPQRLFAFTGRDWIPMHPCPGHPDATEVPLYSFVPSPTANNLCMRRGEL